MIKRLKIDQELRKAEEDKVEDTTDFDKLYSIPRINPNHVRTGKESPEDQLDELPCQWISDQLETLIRCRQSSGVEFGMINTTVKGMALLVHKLVLELGLERVFGIVESRKILNLVSVDKGGSRITDHSEMDEEVVNEQCEGKTVGYRWTEEKFLVQKRTHGPEVPCWSTCRTNNPNFNRALMNAPKEVKELVREIEDIDLMNELLPEDGK